MAKQQRTTLADLKVGARLRATRGPHPKYDSEITAVKSRHIELRNIHAGGRDSNQTWSALSEQLILNTRLVKAAPEHHPSHQRDQELITQGLRRAERANEELSLDEAVRRDEEEEAWEAEQLAALREDEARAARVRAREVARAEVERQTEAQLERQSAARTEAVRLQERAQARESAARKAEVMFPPQTVRVAWTGTPTAPRDLGVYPAGLSRDAMEALFRHGGHPAVQQALGWVPEFGVPDTAAKKRYGTWWQSRDGMPMSRHDHRSIATRVTNGSYDGPSLPASFSVGGDWRANREELLALGMVASVNPGQPSRQITQAPVPSARDLRPIRGEQQQVLDHAVDDERERIRQQSHSGEEAAARRRILERDAAEAEAELGKVHADPVMEAALTPLRAQVAELGQERRALLAAVEQVDRKIGDVNTAISLLEEL